MSSTSIRVPPPAKRSRNLMEFPSELTELILLRVGAFDMIMSARKVCKTWRKICSKPDMYRVVDLRRPNFRDYLDFHVKKIARKAVDLSCGKMIEFRINHFADDDLLNYVSDRSSQLRRLHLASCFNITNEGLNEMLKKLALLEELWLSCLCISKENIEVAGRCCPQLRTFRLNYQGLRDLDFGCDVNALAIAENMHGLRHLQLFGNRITRDGLLVILENCPHLESLDLRRCYRVANLDPDLKRRLSQQIKYLRLPNDSTKDCKFDPEIHLNPSDDDDSLEQPDSDIVFDDYQYYMDDFADIYNSNSSDDKDSSEQSDSDIVTDDYEYYTDDFDCSDIDFD
ncbi:F-box protein SKIP19 [Heracleum sosnowskyi]|uniref:F-box protein SKIP19 n=1 Tax=Heracleum sosnowskyi TaxID=360622 RepID=A0AAD8MMH0_9APIA|nr:F-box protein SKIP19 [Heracleum sosnowskyi]